MADEQQEWLDAEAAEMLLRGEPVEPVDDHARTEARKLEAALLALRTPAPAGDEPAGEAAALAAFREASRRRERVGAGRPDEPVGRKAVLRTARTGKAPGATLRRSRWTRPMRYGLAVSLVGCALGGVAVAGGTGMLPSPFGGQDSPVPATSVSAAASPGEPGAEVPGTGVPSSLPSTTSGTPGTPGTLGTPTASDGPGAGTAGSDGRAGQDGSATEREDGGQVGGTEDAEDGADGTATEDGADGHEASEEPSADVHKRSVKACRAHRKGVLNKHDERLLLEQAGPEGDLARFCDQLLGADTQDSEDAQDKANGGNNGAKSGSDKAGNGKNSRTPASLLAPSPLPSLPDSLP